MKSHPVDSTFLRRSRRSVELDLRTRAGVETALRLIAEADALIEGNRPGVTERLGLGPDSCWAVNPRLVYGRMTGWGQDGTISHTAGHDITYLAVTGALHLVGRAGGPPVVPMNLVGDFGGGSLYLVVGILAALWEARSSGQGQVVDAAIVDGATSLTTLVHGLLAAGTWTTDRGTNLLDGGRPWYDVYRTRDDRYVAVGALEPKFYRELCHLLPLDSNEDERADPSRWPGLRARIAEAFSRRTRDEWAEHFADTDACVAPVLTPEEATENAHLRARGVFTVLDGGHRAARTSPTVQSDSNSDHLGSLGAPSPRRRDHQLVEGCGVTDDLAIAPELAGNASGTTDSLGWGVVLRPRHDPAIDARSAESLGLDHLLLPGNDAVAVLLALGATREITLYVDSLSGCDWIDRVPPDQRARLAERPPAMKVIPARITRPAEATDVAAGAFQSETGACEAFCACPRRSGAGVPQDSEQPREMPGGLVGTISDCRATLAALAATGMRTATFDLIGDDTDRRRTLLLLALDVLPPTRRDGPCLYAQDLDAGTVFELGSYTVTEEDIVSFAYKWDPVDLHIDAGLAEVTPLGRLCASGVHTQAIMQHLTARGLFRSIAVVAGRRSLGMRFLTPVTPGARLHGRIAIVEVRMRPHGRAVVTIKGTLHHAQDLVYEMLGELIVQQR